MPQPPAYTITKDFSQDESNNVSGRSTVLTDSIDTEFVNIKSFIDQMRTNIALIQADDGTIKDDSVDLPTLADNVINYITTNGNGWYGADTGSVNAMVVTLTPAPTALTNGMFVVSDIKLTNTSTAVTLNVNGLGAKAVVVDGAGTLPTVGLLTIGTFYGFQYDSSADKFQTVFSGDSLAQATASANSATASANSATASQNSANAAATSYDDFDDRFLGAKNTSGGFPTVDNDGDALVDGCLMFSTTDNVMFVYDLGNTTWVRTTPTTSEQTNINTVSAKATEIGRLGTADAVADMAILGTTDVVADMNVLATADVVADMNTLGTADVVSDLNTLGTADVVADMNTLATADIVSDMNTLATSANVTAMGHLGTSANVTAMGLLGTSAVVTDMGILGTADVVADMNTLGTADVVNDMNVLGTADVVADMNTLGTADVVTDMNTLGTSANVTAMSNCSGSIANINTTATNIANVNTTASNITGVNSFAERYRVSATEPSSNNDAGDLYFNTTTNELRSFGTVWQATAPSNENQTNINIVAGDVVYAEDLGSIADALTTSTGSDISTVADSIANINALAPSAVIADMALLGTTDCVADMNTLATADIVSDMNTLATADVVSDMNTLGTADCVADMNTLGTSQNVTNMNTVAGSIADVNRYAEEYKIASSAPGSPSEGDLWYDSTNNVLKVHNGTSFVAVTSATAGIMHVVDDASPELGGNLDVLARSIVSSSNRDITLAPHGTGKVLVGALDCQNNNVSNCGTISGSNLQIDFGSI